jgi:misacylated tRNA(Ala) deacylase
MVDEKYLEDSYLKEFDTEVVDVKDGKYIVLKKTIFYPNSGGQPHDLGKLIRESDGKEFNVVYCAKFDGKISHEIDNVGLEKGDKVKCVIDWDRRYKFMRMHTAAHVLARVLYDETGANTSGNQLDLEQSRIDFTLENYDKDEILTCIDKTNAIISEGGKVTKSFMTQEETEKIEGFAAPSPHLKQSFDTLRVVDIHGIDVQPCGGTHLDSINEIGEIVFVKAKNKGKSNRRIYYALKN